MPSRYTFIAIVTLGASAGVAAPAAAGFILEGLEPFSIRACDDGAVPRAQGPSGQPPLVEGSPSAFNDGGIARFRAQPCPQPQPQTRGAPARRTGRPPVHQK